jgi:hypothetical protein
MLGMGRPRVWTRRSAIWAVAGALVVLATVAAWLLRMPPVPVGSGFVVGFGLTGYGVALRRLAADPRVQSAAAAQLADAVARREAAVLRRLLTDRVGTGRPQSAQVRWRTAGGAETGSLNTLADFYLRLPHGRLVVVGPAGSGKTVVALRCLLDLIAALPEEPGVRVRVPVRLTGAELSRIDAHLASTYRLRPAVARALVTHDWILPVLDGSVLDGADPVPAGPVVATSAEDVAVADAAVVHLQPLTIEEVAAWLTYQFPDPTKPPGVEHRWLRVLRHLGADPTGRLATALRQPLRLSRAVAAYRDPASDPSELLSQPGDRLTA